MKFLKKHKRAFTVLMILGMFMQILAPAGGVFASAEENTLPNDLEEVLEEVDTGEDQAVLADEVEQTTDDNEDSEDDVKATNDLDPVTWDDVKIVDSKGKETTGPFQKGDDVIIRFEYSIENHMTVQTSNKYEFTIPKEIPIINDVDKTLFANIVDIEGNITGKREIGKIVLKTDGTMNVNFIDEINNEDFIENRNGWVTITSKFDEGIFDGSEDKLITFEFNGKSKDIKVRLPKVGEKENVELKKSGEYNNETNEITWTVVVKPTTEPAGRTIKNIVI